MLTQNFKQIVLSVLMSEISVLKFEKTVYLNINGDAELHFLLQILRRPVSILHLSHNLLAHPFVIVLPNIPLYINQFKLITLFPGNAAIRLQNASV